MTFGFWFAEITAWIAIALCWWLVHLRSNLRPAWAVARRLGYALLGLALLAYALQPMPGAAFLFAAGVNLVLCCVLIVIIWRHDAASG